MLLWWTSLTRFLQTLLEMLKEKSQAQVHWVDTSACPTRSWSASRRQGLRWWSMPILSHQLNASLPSLTHSFSPFSITLFQPCLPSCTMIIFTIDGQATLLLHNEVPKSGTKKTLMGKSVFSSPRHSLNREISLWS